MLRVSIEMNNRKTTNDYSDEGRSQLCYYIIGKICTVHEDSVKICPNMLTICTKYAEYAKNVHQIRTICKKCEKICKKNIYAKII